MTSRQLLSRQRGAVAVIVSLCLLGMIALIGLALDTARIYNRRVELHTVANAAALAAAAQLNGTPAGLGAATAAARAVVESHQYKYNTRPLAWADGALEFSATAPPDAAWTNAGGATGSAASVFYAKVDIASLDGQAGVVETLFMRVIAGTAESVSLNHVAVAGRTSINATPLAICALAAAPAAARANPGPPANVELVEFGFRRGVSYDLMQLNSNGSSGATFIVDPVTPAGKSGKASLTSPSLVGPFVCTGSMWRAHLAGGVNVAQPFPLASLYTQLNSRFGQYDGACKPNGAPPDYNVKVYNFNGGAAWMASAMAGQAAQSLQSEGKLWTVADPTPMPASNTAPAYGPLWSYARAVPFSSYVSGGAEPANGYNTFATSAWATLYKPGPSVTSYPNLGSANTPYQSNSAAYATAASEPYRAISTRNRRVLNIPLLACPVGAPGNATVLGIGRFFMTVPATSTTLYAEFAGALTTASNGGQVELL